MYRAITRIDVFSAAFSLWYVAVRVAEVTDLSMKMSYCHFIVQRAEVLGREDEFRLLKNRQLALLVDLDQTLASHNEW